MEIPKGMLKPAGRAAKPRAKKIIRGISPMTAKRPEEPAGRAALFPVMNKSGGGFGQKKINFQANVAVRAFDSLINRKQIRQKLF